VPEGVPAVGRTAERGPVRLWKRTSYNVSMLAACRGGAVYPGRGISSASALERSSVASAAGLTRDMCTHKHRVNPRYVHAGMHLYIEGLLCQKGSPPSEGQPGACQSACEKRCETRKWHTS